MTLQGPVVALAAQGHLLAMVWHASLPASSEDQSLQYAVLDVSQQQQVQSLSLCGSLCLFVNLSVSATLGE